jgi:hypothetical protein
MSKAVDNLQDAQPRAMAGRPRVGGFPYLAVNFVAQASRATAGSFPPAKAYTSPKTDP